MSSALPIEGCWYRHRNEEAFLVIAVHEHDGLIDVRDNYGDVDEFNFEEWDRMNLQPCEAPEWEPPFDETTIVIPAETAGRLR